MIGRLFIWMLLALVLAALPAGAELRQWTDENGIKHFSNKADLPEGVSVESTFKEKESPAVERRPNRNATRANPSKTGTNQIRKTRTRPDKATVQEEIRIRETQLRDLFDRIYTKRRYVKRRGKQDIERIRRLTGEIDALEKSGTDPARIDQLKAERAAAKERLFNENLRTRKGVGQDIQEYKKIEDEIAELKKNL
jgi:septal ring factor EnvC (AmiA/AmiB activator)